jgi:hypothetical protein
MISTRPLTIHQAFDTLTDLDGVTSRIHHQLHYMNTPDT